MHGDSATILHQRWQAVVAARGPEVAVHLSGTGESITFAGLAAMAAARPPAPAVFPTTNTGLAFLLDVLNAWRDRSVLIPDDTGSQIAPSAEVLPSGPCHIKATSGSSGNRKGVLFTGAQLAADADQIVHTMELTPGRPNFGVISLAHSYGFSNLVLPLFLHGIPLWLAGNAFPSTVAEVFSGGTPLTVPAVPAMWRAWEMAELDFSAIKLAISAGAPLPLALESNVFARTGVKLHNFYGSSECGGIAYDRSAKPRTDASHAGTAMEGVQLSVDPTSCCLNVKSAATGFGYIDDSGELSGFPHHTFSTSDLAEIDPGTGCVRLIGRAGETVNIAGYKVSPSTIEEALLRLPGVSACVAFGVPSVDAIRVDELVTVVNASVPLADLQAALAHLPSAYHPRHWWLNDSLASDRRGKISRAAWKAMWLEKKRE